LTEKSAKLWYILGSTSWPPALFWRPDLKTTRRFHLPFNLTSSIQNMSLF
jgi:hypothetical protein